MPQSRRVCRSRSVGGGGEDAGDGGEQRWLFTARRGCAGVCDDLAGPHSDVSLAAHLLLLFPPIRLSIFSRLLPFSPLTTSSLPVLVHLLLFYFFYPGRHTVGWGLGGGCHNISTFPSHFLFQSQMHCDLLRMRYYAAEADYT